ncbi:adenylate/guanylate cyclase domain-containing protein [Rubrivirga sp.]|uniref:adenylate/guanylate cyclase domain-containing protein n=1 Tax=Rubrivirga sp. TaxID=1885344 RepID=UPI003B51BAB6
MAVAIGSARDLDAAVHALVRRSLRAIGAAQGVVTLVNSHSGTSGETFVRTAVGPGSAFRPDEALLGWMGLHRRTLRLDAPHAEAPFASFDWDDSVETVLCAPLIANARFLGVLTLYNKRDGGTFSEGDARLLTILAMQSAQTLDAAQREAERSRILNLFGRHTAPAVVDELLRHEADPPVRRIAVCVMFLDVRGFTTFAEGSEPEAVVEFLNRFFGLTIDAVTSRGGIVHQLLGDGFMAIFGAPLSTPDDCTNAVEAALDIVARVEGEVAAGQLRATRVGIGLHAGDVVAGTVGSAQHKEYKVTGDVVNVASRVEGLNKELEAQVLASDAVWRRLPPGRFEAEPLGSVPLRGRAEGIELFRLA